MYFTHWQSRFGASLMIPPSSIQDIIKKSGYAQIQRLSHFNIRFPIDLSIGNVEIVYQRQIFQKKNLKYRRFVKFINAARRQCLYG